MTNEQMDRNRKLIEALRSGQYEQTRGVLQRDGAFCCLGVACDLAAREGLGEWGQEDDAVLCFNTDTQSHAALPPQAIAHWYGWSYPDPELLTEDGRYRPATYFNDSMKLSFKEIADAFERTFAVERI